MRGYFSKSEKAESRRKLKNIDSSLLYNDLNGIAETGKKGVTRI